MHIPDGFLNPKVLIVTTAISAGFLLPAVKRVNETLSSKRIPLMGLAASFVFTVQLLAFPVIGGTSAHLVGAVLISVLLGPLSGVTIMTAALFLQALLFQHGGLLTLGANVLNMGVAGCLPGYLIYRFSPRKIKLPAAALAAWVSVVLASALCAAELGLSGKIPLKLGLASMTSFHAIVGIIEGIVTLMILSLMQRVRPDLLGLKKI